MTAVASAPFWLYQLWAFIAPALHRKERRKSVLFIIAATPFFTLGAALAYYILPIAIRVLFGFTPDSLNNLVRFDDYLSFVLRIILIFGLAFELPVFLVSLNLIGVLSGRAILKPWRFAIFGITVFVAAFSPTPRWGGLAMWLAMALTLVIANYLPLVHKSFGQEATGIFLSGSFILFLGLLDDRFDLDPITKFAGQALANFVIGSRSNRSSRSPRNKIKLPLKKIPVASCPNDLCTSGK